MSKYIPLIGIFGWKTGDNSFGATLPYLELLGDYGNIRILTLNEPVDDRLDLLVVPGGADVSTYRYNEIPSFYTSKPDPWKEYQDTHILPEYIKAKVPILGICRGIQTIAVLFGAKLIQHMWHETNDADKRYDTVHEISLVEGTSFKKEYEAVSKDKIKVNSMHHQCVSSRDFPDCLEILGVYKSSSNARRLSSIEMLRHKTLPIYGIQYHPEELGYDHLSAYLINKLITQSKNYTTNE